jgi:hypothetical protein
MGFLRPVVGGMSLGFVRFMQLSILRERQNQYAPRKVGKCDSQVRHEEAASGGRTAPIQHFVVKAGPHAGVNTFLLQAGDQGKRP